MKLYKDGIIKEILREKTINRLLRQGWKSTTEENSAVEQVDVEQEAPKRRGRPARAVDVNN
jgi:hypothetical protein